MCVSLSERLSSPRLCSTIPLYISSAASPSMTECVFQLIHNANSFKRDYGAVALREVKRGTSAISTELLTVIVSVEKLSKNYNLNKIKREDMIIITYQYNKDGFVNARQTDHSSRHKYI